MSGPISGAYLGRVGVGDKNRYRGIWGPWFLRANRPEALERHQRQKEQSCWTWEAAFQREVEELESCRERARREVQTIYLTPDSLRWCAEVHERFRVYLMSRTAEDEQTENQTKMDREEGDQKAKVLKPGSSRSCDVVEVCANRWLCSFVSRAILQACPRRCYSRF